MKKNYWFRLDCDFLSDPKIQDIHFALGNDAVVAYLVAVIRLYRNGGKLGVDKYSQIAYEAHTSIEAVKKVVEDYGLFVLDGDSFYSIRVLEELDVQRGISEIRAEAGRRGAQQRLANAQAIAQANAKQMLKQNASKNQANTITNTMTNTEDINNPSSKDSGLCFPADAENAQDGEKILSNKQCQQVIDYWNETVVATGAAFSRVELLSDARKKKIRVRWREFSRLGDPVEVCRTIFKKACASKFLQGDNKNGWSASFDWIFTNDKNWAKIYEGNYDDRQAPQQQSHLDKMQEDLDYIHQFFNGGNGDGRQQQDTNPFEEQ